MTVEDAIKRIDDILDSDVHWDESIDYKLMSIDVDWLGKSKEALEKQIPKKPFIKYHKEDVTPVKYGRLMEFHCPNCDRLVAAMYETDHKRGGGVHRDLKGCHTCLQAIDFGEYYYMSNLDDEIELE